MTSSLPTPSGGLAGLNILVVEDEVLLASEIVDELEAAGAVVIGPLPSVGKALEVLDSDERIDAALLNVYLRGAVSFLIAEALTKRATPFIFVTGNDEYVRQIYPDVPVHTKPSDIPLILRTLEALVSSRCGASAEQ